MILIVQKTVKEHTNAVCVILYCIFLTWGPFLLKSGPLCITISFLFVILSPVAGITWWELKTRGWGQGINLINLKREKKAGLYGSWSMHKGGGVLKAFVTHLSLGLEGIFFLCPFFFFLDHLLCCLPPPPTPSYFPFFMFLTYSTSPCCVFLNQWTSHLKHCGVFL